MRLSLIHIYLDDFDLEDEEEYLTEDEETEEKNE